MTTATTRRLFFLGTILFTLAFIALTVHTHTTIASRTHTEHLTDDVRRGGRVWAKYNCENCHTLLGEGAYYAPDLTQVVQQRGAAYLAQFLANPAQFYSEARDGRLMPTLGLTAQEIADVLAFLVSGVAVRAMPGVSGVASAPEPASRGKVLFNGTAACASCHSVEPGVVLVGPSLAGVAKTAADRVQDPQYHGTARTADAYLDSI